MNTTLIKIPHTLLKGVLLITIGSFLLNSGCKKSDSTVNNIITSTSYQQVTLVADSAGFNAGRLDPMLLNAWGIAIRPNGEIWLAVNHSGAAIIYDHSGAQLSSPVNIPLGSLPNGASPDGAIYNSTTDFVIPGQGPALFIFATEDGLLQAWNASSGATTMVVADRSGAGAVYKGIAMGSDGGANFLYVTDFFNGKVDVFDKTFKLVTTKPFADPAIPAGYTPFNVANIGGQLFVSYAKQLAPDNHDDEAGPGHGYVDIYTTAGVLVKRFVSGGMLNSPWAIAQTSAGFGQVANAILIGNFGDGNINVYNSDGAFQGKLMQGSNPVSIPGLWAISFDNVAPADPNFLYFTAGPTKEAHGLFGYLKKN